MDRLNDSFQYLLDLALIQLPLRVRKKNVICNVFSNRDQAAGRALVYYKTDPFFSKRLRDSYQHTNNSEIYRMVKVLHRRGYVVDVVDRSASWDEIAFLRDFQYEIYIGNAAGNNAPLHESILNRLTFRIGIFFAMGPEPEYSARLVMERHREFDQRTGQQSIPRRVVRGEDFDRRMNGMDAIFFFGNSFSEDSYRKYGLPMYRMYPSTSPILDFPLQELRRKDRRHFIYFGGNGLICKGADLVLEAFDGLADVRLDVFGPSGETDFWTYYEPLMRRNPQIRFHGFVKVSSKLFLESTDTAAFNIFPSSSEGCATSVVTCMRRGVIPVVTRESGVDIDDFGFPIVDITPAGLRALVERLVKVPAPELESRVQSTIAAAQRYTLESFEASFERALDSVL